MNKTRLRKQQRNERMQLMDLIDRTSDDKEMTLLNARMLDMTNRHRAEKEGRIMPKVKVKPPVLTVNLYHDLRAQGLKDKAIAQHVEVSRATLNKFKNEQGLVAKREDANPVAEAELKAQQAPVEKKTVDEKPQVHEVQILAQYEKERLEREAQLWRDRFKQKEDELMEFMGDYRKLENDFLNSQYESKRLLAMLDRLKRTEQINVWLMEQHIGFMEQLDAVAGGQA